MIRRRTLSLLGAFALLLLPRIASAVTIFPPFLTCEAGYDSRSGWYYKVDPLFVDSFQLDVQFDPARASFAGITYISPFVEVTPPDLSELSLGFIRRITGQASGSVPSGDVDVFALNFTDLHPELNPAAAVFTVFGGPDSFIRLLDTDTGGFVTITNGDCGSCSDHVPEPATGFLLASGLGGLLISGFGGLRASRRRSRF